MLRTPHRSILAAVGLLMSLAGVARGEDTAPADAYPRGELLVESAELAKSATAKAAVVLDVRDAKSHAAGRVPGARRVDISAWAKAFGDGTDAKGWTERIGAAGIGNDSAVVVYDAGDWKDAARVWWILRYWGVKDARLLNGGYAAWTAAKLSVETGEPSQPAAKAKFAPQPERGRLATKKSLLDSLAAHSVQVLDARSKDEHCGVAKLNNKRAGAIPGSKHLEWSDLIQADSKRIKPASELQKLFAGAGLDLAQPIAAHCQSGGRSSVMAFGLELMGAEHVQNYYASWAEWGNADDTPVETEKPVESEK